MRARRWDVTAANLGTPADPLPGTAHSAEAINTFDASDERVIEQTYGAGGTKQNVFVFDTLDSSGAGGIWRGKWWTRRRGWLRPRRF